MPASSLRMEHSLMGTSSPRVYNRVKHKNVKMCWLTSDDALFIPEDGTLPDGILIFTYVHCTIGLKTKMCWLPSANTRFISENGTLQYSMEPLLYVCTIGLKTKKCWLTSADARLIPKDGTLLNGPEDLEHLLDLLLAQLLRNHSHEQLSL